MRLEVIGPFGFAKPGDILAMAQPVDPARAYWRGMLRTGRKYTEFVAPYEVLRMVSQVDTPEDVEYHARRTDPATAQAELERLGQTRSERERRIVATIAQRGRQGATSKEVAEITGIPHVSTSTTMSRLITRKVLAESHASRNNALVRVLPEFAPEAR